MEYKTKNMNLQLFAGGTITDLTGTTWVFNSTITTAPNGWRLDDSNGYDDTYYINFLVSDSTSTFIQFRDTDLGSGDINYSFSGVYTIGSGWLYEIARTITITGGTDATNNTLITWLQNNATQVPVSDLTNTTWVLNNNIDLTTINYDTSFYINFKFESYNYNLGWMRFYDSQADYDYNVNLAYESYEVYSSFSGWNSNNYKTIQITNGQDVTNPDLIAWLSQNATQQIAQGYTSTITLTNCTCNKSSETGLSGSYSATVTASSGYYLSSVTSTLGTATISTDKHTATIEITDVTEDFTITGIGTAILYKNVELSPNANGIVDYTTVLLPKAMSDSSKQDTLTTAQMTAVNSGITSTLVGQIGTNQSNISGIQELIPVQATTSNQLADKDFVNSSIATNTANFIGTFANITALNNYVGTVTNNDYANVINQELDFATTTEMNNYNKALLSNYDYGWVVNGTKYDLYRFDIETQTWGVRATNINKGDVTLISAYNRYIYSATLSQWAWNYTINTSGFTASQWAAINSGATAEQIQELADLLAGNGTKTINNTSIIGTGNIDTKEIFVCTHGTTTFAEITTALSNGKLPICFYNDREYIYCSQSSTVYRFSSMQSDYVRYITVDNTDNWSSVSAYRLELATNKVTSINASSTDTQYPSAKCVYDALATKSTVTFVRWS